MKKYYLLLILLSGLLPLTGCGRLPATSTAQAEIPDAHLTDPLAVPQNQKINVAFLLSPGAEVIDFGGPWGVFNYVILGPMSRRPFATYTVAATTAPVEVSGGLVVVPKYSFETAPAPDVVVVPAVDDSQLDRSALDWLRSVQGHTAVTMSVCNGSFVLGRAGLLDGRRATAHHAGYVLLRAEFPKVSVVRAVRFVDNGRIATAGGLTSGIDLALHIVERYFGRETAQRTATTLEYQGLGWKSPQNNAEFAKRPVGTANRPICPVCEMAVTTASPFAAEFHGKRYYFCSKECRDLFMAHPGHFVDDDP